MEIEGKIEPWSISIAVKPDDDPRLEVGEVRFVEGKAGLDSESLRPLFRRRVRVIEKGYVAGMVKYRFEAAPLPADPT